MTSDESDEDADTLDDADLLENYLTTDTTGHNAPNSPPTAIVVDWPWPGPPEPGPAIDPAMLAWFKARHPDWRNRMDEILRAWMFARRQGRAPIAPTAAPDERTPG